MKRVFSLMLLLSLIFGCFAMADEVYEEPQRADTDSLSWDFDADTGMLSIHGTGPMRSYAADYPEWETYKDQITSVILDEGITSIGECAFYDYENLESAVLPDSIEVIDRNAFYYCWELRSITIPQKLRYVGDGAFYNTLIHEPVDIIFPEGTEYIGDEAFHSAMKTDGIYGIPSTVRYIGSCAFSNAMVSDIVVSDANTVYKSENHALLTKDGTELLLYSSCAEATSYSVPDGVTKIDAQCFNVPQNLEKLYIPASVTEIEDGAIFSTFNLNEITVAEDNPAYKVIDGALCTIDGKNYIAFPDGIQLNEIRIPNGVERIAPYVFYGRFDEDVVITLPEFVKTICKLSMPSDIATITVPKGIETIEDYAFCYDGGVDTVLYGGTEADWQSIKIGEGNVGLSNAEIRYNE